MSLFGNNKKSPVWIQKTHYLKSDEFICSVCGFKAKKAYKNCPGCKNGFSKVKYEPSWVDEAEFVDMMFDD